MIVIFLIISKIKRLILRKIVKKREKGNIKENHKVFLVRDKIKNTILIKLITFHLHFGQLPDNLL